MCGSNSPPIQMAVRQMAAPAIAQAKAMEKLRVSKESTPPIQRSAPSSSGGPTSLGIRRESSSVRKRNVSSGRRTSKSKSFSTRNK